MLKHFTAFPVIILMPSWHSWQFLHPLLNARFSSW